MGMFVLMLCKVLSQGLVNKKIIEDIHNKEENHVPVFSSKTFPFNLGIQGGYIWYFDLFIHSLKDTFKLYD